MAMQEAAGEGGQEEHPVADGPGASTPAARTLPEQLEFPDALALAIERRGLSLTRLHAALVEVGSPVSLATLSHWRSGRSRPERRNALLALERLEMLLRLRPGELYRRIGPSARTGPVPEVGYAMLDFPHHRDLAAAQREIGCPPPHFHVRQVMRVVAVVDAAHVLRTVRTRSVVRAQRDGVDRLPAVLSLTGVTEGATFEAVDGCTVGRTFEHREQGVFAAEMVLDRPLGRGESTVVEYVVGHPRCEPNIPFYEHIAVRRVLEVEIEVQFYPGSLPGEAVGYTEFKGRRLEHQLTIDSRGRVREFATDFGPGSIGVRWGRDHLRA